VTEAAQAAMIEAKANHSIPPRRDKGWAPEDRASAKESRHETADSRKQDRVLPDGHQRCSSVWLPKRCAGGEDDGKSLHLAGGFALLTADFSGP
jgi:hypothetical protein